MSKVVAEKDAKEKESCSEEEEHDINFLLDS